VSSCAKFIHEHSIGISTAALQPKKAVRVAKHYASDPCKLTISSYLFARWPLFRHVGFLRHAQQVDLLTSKVLSESRVTWATFVPILVFLGLSVLGLGPMYATDRQTYVRRQRDVRQKHRIITKNFME